jgi:hypothetical protein
VNAGEFFCLASQEGLCCTILRRYNVDGRIKINLSASIEAISQHRVEGLSNLSHSIQGQGTSQNKSTALPALTIHKENLFVNDLYKNDVTLMICIGRNREVTKVNFGSWRIIYV